MIIIFFGPPGAGKGTQSLLSANHLQIPHLSTGEILRKKLLEKDSTAEYLKKTMDNGDLVSDEILNKIVSARIEEEECKHGFILDGYPRTILQANFLNEFLKLRDLSISFIINLVVGNDTIIKRIKSRSNIENREDDKDEIIQNRISKYNKETEPLSEFYKQEYKLNYLEINGDQEIEKIQEDILKMLKK